MKQDRHQIKTSSKMKSRKSALALKQLSPSFCWDLLLALSRDLSSELTSEQAKDIFDVIRRRDVPGYFALDAKHGLQCISRECRPRPGNPAVRRLLTAILRKNTSFATKTPEERKFDAIELVKKLDCRPRPLILGRRNRDENDVFMLVKERISEILGDVPTSNMIAVRAMHGPGSTATTPYAARSTYFKYNSWPYACSPRARALFTEVMTSDERWIGSLEQAYRSAESIPVWAVLNQDLFKERMVKDLPYNVVTSVPKDGTKDRPIAKEPIANVLLQIAVGTYIKERMLLAGNDLSDQSDNRSLALAASIYSTPDSPCTFDLSNASDTIQRCLVKAILPRDWFELLDSVRSPYGLFPDGTGWIYSKMSSMGNATTFELESLIFYCILFAVSEVYGYPWFDDVAWNTLDKNNPRIRVFGDDLLFPRYLAKHVEVYLRAFGFDVNTDKSFSTGELFESCGVDCLSGVNIRPVSLKDVPETLPELLSIRNRLNRWYCQHLGCELSQDLDAFFLKYVSGQKKLPTGPENDTEFDSYWHTQKGRRSDVKFKSLSGRTQVVKADDMWFRKLMHNLKNCESESAGSRFAVTEPTGGWRVVCRSQPNRSYYRDDSTGIEQTHVRPKWGE